MPFLTPNKSIGTPTRTIFGDIFPFIGKYKPFVKPIIYLNKPFVCVGFTLIELVITLLIAVAILMVATPGISRFIHSNRLAGASNGFVGSISLARSEALKQGQNTGICPSISGTSCDSTNWVNGWIVFLDANGNAAWNSSDTVLRSYPTLSGTTVTASTNLIIYDRQGLLPTGAGGYVFCSTPLQRSRVVTLRATGHHRAGDGTC